MSIGSDLSDWPDDLDLLRLPVLASQSLTGSMAEAFGLYSKIESYQGTRPITLDTFEIRGATGVDNRNPRGIVPWITKEGDFDSTARHDR